MKKRSFLILFTSINLLFISAQIYKHTRIVQLNYAHNTLNTESKKLDHTLETLRQKICVHTNTQSIKAYAQNVLQMKPLSLTKVTRIMP